MWQLRSIVMRGLYSPRWQEFGILPVRRMIPFLSSNRPGMIRKRAATSDFIGTLLRYSDLEPSLDPSKSNVAFTGRLSFLSPF
jgi:hypothetical protein